MGEGSGCSFWMLRRAQDAQQGFNKGGRTAFADYDSLARGSVMYASERAKKWYGSEGSELQTSEKLERRKFLSLVGDEAARVWRRLELEERRRSGGCCTRAARKSRESTGKRENLRFLILCYYLHDHF